MYTTIEMLIWRLQQIRNGTVKVVAIEDAEDKLHRRFIHDEQTDSLACEYLIAGNGQVNWFNVKILEKAGFPVFAVERDSFGWLIGGISTGRGIITFG